MTTISIKGRETSDELNLDTMCKHIALLRNLIVGHTLLHRVHDSTPHDTPQDMCDKPYVLNVTCTKFDLSPPPCRFPTHRELHFTPFKLSFRLSIDKPYIQDADASHSSL